MFIIFKKKVQMNSAEFEQFEAEIHSRISKIEELLSQLLIKKDDFFVQSSLYEEFESLERLCIYKQKKSVSKLYFRRESLWGK